MPAVGSTFTAPVTLQGSSEHKSFFGATTPGTLQSLFSFNVPPNKTDTIYAVYVDSRTEGRCTIEHTPGADPVKIIGSFRVGPANPTGNYVFYLPYAVPSGDLFEVKFTAVSGTPTVDIAAYVQLTEQ